MIKGMAEMSRDSSLGLWQQSSKVTHQWRRLMAPAACKACTREGAGPGVLLTAMTAGPGQQPICLGREHLTLLLPACGVLHCGGRKLLGACLWGLYQLSGCKAR